MHKCSFLKQEELSERKVGECQGWSEGHPWGIMDIVGVVI